MEITCSAILFDLDGVLVDSTAVIERHWRLWAASHNIAIERVMAVSHGRTSAATVKLVAPHLDAEFEGRAREAKEGIDTDGLVAFPAARSLLTSLPVDTWAVVTSGNLQTATVRLQFDDLPLPNVLITADDVTRSKPDPEPYLLGAERLGIDPEHCLVFEDAPNGITAASAAGMKTIALATTHVAEELSQAEVVVPDLGGISVTATGDKLQVSIRDAAE